MSERTILVPESESPVEDLLVSFHSRFVSSFTRRSSLFLPPVNDRVVGDGIDKSSFLVRCLVVVHMLECSKDVVVRVMESVPIELCGEKERTKGGVNRRDRQYLSFYRSSVWIDSKSRCNRWVESVLGGGTRKTDLKREVC